MAKIQVTLDATKLRNLVSSRTYKNREGADVEVQEIKFELVEVKEAKSIYKADKYEIMKTHFCAVIQSKEEREQTADTIYIGEGFTTVWNNATETHVAVPIATTQNEDPLF